MKESETGFSWLFDKKAKIFMIPYITEFYGFMH